LTTGWIDFRLLSPSQPADYARCRCREPSLPVRRSGLTALERFLARFSPPFVVLVGLLVLSLIGLIDATLREQQYQAARDPNGPPVGSGLRGQPTRWDPRSSAVPRPG
jgi:hypothetical protein